MTYGLAVWEAVVLLAALLHRSTNASVLGRYSEGYFVGLGGVALLSAALWGVALWVWRSTNERLGNLAVWCFERRARAGFRWGAQLSAALSIAVASLVVGFGREELVYAVLRLHLALMTFGGLYLLLFAGETSRPASGRWWRLLALLTVCAIALANLVSLPYAPSLHITDEGWDMNRAWTYMETGLLYERMSLGEYGIPNPFIAYVHALLGEWFRLVGVGFVQGRVFYWLWGMVLLVFVFLAARRMYGSWAAWASVAFVAASPTLTLGFRIRHDIALAAVVMAVLWLHLVADQDNRRWAHYAAGLLMGLGMEAHLHAALFCVAWAGVYVVRYINQVRHRGCRWPDVGFWLFAAGGLSAAGVYLLLHVLPDTNAYFSSPYSHQVLTSVLNFDPIQRELTRYYSYLMHYPLESLIILLAAGAAVWRRSRSDRLWLTIILLVVVAFAIGPALTVEYYMVPLVPLFLLPTGKLLVDGIRRGAEKPYPVTDVSFAALLVASGLLLGAGVQRFANAWRGDSVQVHLRAGQAVADLTSPEQTVVAYNVYFLVLHDYERFLSPDTFAMLQTHMSADQAWDTMNPDVVVVDHWLPFGPYPYLLEYVHNRGYEHVATLRNGKVVVYRRPPQVTGIDDG